jgi:hypothetical protein
MLFQLKLIKYCYSIWDDAHLLVHYWRWKGNEKSIVVAMHENDLKPFLKFYKKATWIKFSTWVI